jgi:colanic acid biosynthesis glycosyl transferase WcaI
VPSKLTSYFVSGRPILAATSAGGATAGEITASEAGIIVPPGDPAALLASALDIGSDRARGAEMGRAGQHYAKSTLDADVTLDGYERWCESLVR